jgi:hypothetical protein
MQETRKTSREQQTSTGVDARRAGRLAAAARLVGGDALTGSDVDVGFRVVSSDAAAHALLNLAGHGQEGLLDVASVLGRSLEEGDAERVGEFLGWSAPCREKRGHA